MKLSKKKEKELYNIVHESIMQVIIEHLMGYVYESWNGSDPIKYLTKRKCKFCNKIASEISALESQISEHKDIPSNQELEKEAREYAIHHSEAPDKETPDWIINDWMAGALYVRAFYLGVINYESQIEKVESEPVKEELNDNEKALCSNCGKTLYDCDNSCWYKADPKEEGKDEQIRLMILHILKDMIQYQDEAMLHLTDELDEVSCIIIRSINQYYASLPAKSEQKEKQPTDEDIWNAAKDYAEENGRAFYSEHFQAYKAGATDMNNNNIYISTTTKDGKITNH